MKVELSISSLSVPISTPLENPVRIISLRIQKRHATIIQRLVSGLISKGATLENGRPVRSHHAGMLWLIEQIGKNNTAC